MYQIFINNTEQVQGPGKLVISPVLKEVVGKAGTLKYKIPFNDPIYSIYREKVTTVEVRKEGVTLPIWQGRLLTIGKDFKGTRELEFEGSLAYLNDIKYPPFTYTGDVRGLVVDVLTYYNAHCSEGRKISVGTVTVTDPNDYIRRESENYMSCWEVLAEKLEKLNGGYFQIRYTDGGRFLDYLTDPGSHNTQTIRFGKNLLDIEHYIDATDLATVIIPIGAELEEGGNVTIESVNDGKNYIETDFIEAYGRIETVVEFPDVTLPENLLRKAEEYAGAMLAAAVEIKAAVVDLNIIDDTVEPLRVGDVVECISEPHDLEITLLCAERERNLNAPQQDRVTLGNRKPKYTEQQSANNKKIEDEQETQKRYSADLAQRIENAKGLYTSVTEDESGANILWFHDQQNLADSMLLMQFSTEGIHFSGDGGASWYGQDFNGDFLARLIDTYKISADLIYGGTLSSVATDSAGNPITYIDMNTGDVVKMGNIAWIRRTSGNESLKWMGVSEE